MALTLNQICGFETGGLEEASSTVGTPDCTEATVVNSGGSERSCRLNSTSGASYTINLFDEVASAGNDHVFGAAFRLATGVTPAATVNIIQISSDSPSAVMNLQLQTDGTLDLIDDAGTTLASSGTLSVDTWYYVEVYFQYLTSNASWEIFLDGSSLGSGSTADFADAGNLVSAQFQSTTNLDGNLYIDDFYWLSGATAATDRLGHTFHVRGFQAGAANTTIDYGSGTVTGNWSNTGERAASESNTCVMADGPGAVKYDTANSGGAGPGPSSGSGSLPASDSEIVVAKCWWHIKRGNGADRTHGTMFGNTGDGPSLDTSLDSIIDTAYIDYFQVSESATVVPLTTEDFAIGFGHSTQGGGQDTDCSEMMAMLAWVSEPTQPTLSALSDGHMGQQNSFHGPFEKS